MLTGYDSVTASNLPHGGDLYFGYVNGIYRNITEVRARFPNTPVLSIAINVSVDADVLDIERGDATPAQAPGWATRQLARGRIPILYASQSAMPAVLSALAGAGIARSKVKLWSADYRERHLCSPAACRAAFTADATQYQGSPGNSPGPYDVTVAVAGFDVLTAPQLVSYEEEDMVIVFHSPDGKTALAAVPGCGLVGVSSVASAQAMYPGYREARPTPAEWADILANYRGQKK